MGGSSECLHLNAPNEDFEVKLSILLRSGEDSGEHGADMQTVNWPSTAVGSSHHKILSQEEAVAVGSLVCVHNPHQEHHVGPAVGNSLLSPMYLPCVDFDNTNNDDENQLQAL